MWERTLGNRPGELAWQWYHAKNESVLNCVVWSNGTSEGAQCTPYSFAETTRSSGFRWWPCIVLETTLALKGFYCPVLAVNDSRPWYTHHSRLWYVDGLWFPDVPDVSEVSYVDSPGPYIESVHEDDDDDLSLGEDCNSNVYLREHGDDDMSLGDDGGGDPTGSPGNGGADPSAMYSPDDLHACDHIADVYDSDWNLPSLCIESPREDDDEVLSLGDDDFVYNTDVYDSDGNLLSPCIESDDDWHACD
jgi:hypothetical protein